MYSTVQYSTLLYCTVPYRTVHPVQRRTIAAEVSLLALSRPQACLETTQGPRTSADTVERIRKDGNAVRRRRERRRQAVEKDSADVSCSS
jgi:hypothetical protein